MWGGIDIVDTDLHGNGLIVLSGTSQITALVDHPTGARAKMTKAFVAGTAVDFAAGYKTASVSP